MGDKSNFNAIFGALIILVSLAELALCFWGPVVLEHKSTVFVYPFYRENNSPVTSSIQKDFETHLVRSRKFMLITKDYAEDFFTREGGSFPKILEHPSSDGYAKAADRLGAEKFIMGYILEISGDFEMFVNLHLTRQARSVLTEKIKAPDAGHLVRQIPELISKLEGEDRGFSLLEILYLTMVIMHVFFGVCLLFPFIWTGVFSLKGRFPRFRVFLEIRLPEFLFSITFLIFIYSLIYALNANMDYVQQFIATRGGIHLAQNAGQEHFNTFIRYLPLLCLTGSFFVWLRMGKYGTAMMEGLSRDFRIQWAMPLTIFSAFIVSISLPSFLCLDGLPVLAYVGLVPFLLVVEKNTYFSSVFYGILFGIFNTVFTNFWLGTFNLVSLQVVTLIFLTAYKVFMFPAVLIYKRSGFLRFLVFPAAWVAFDYLQSIDFAGYPWGMFGVSQYRFLPLIQTAAITGVWGVTFLVVMANASAAHAVSMLLEKKPKRIVFPLALFGGFFAVCLIGGMIYLGVSEKVRVEKKTGSVRVAQVQDSMDPRKHGTREVLEKLMALTREALKEKPDLVVWPEGTFDNDYFLLPNSLYAEKLRDFQVSTGTWLLTGCLSYRDEEYIGPVDFTRDFAFHNSSMLLDHRAEGKQRYHKIHLVPYTEYFPYEKEFPGIYRALKDFDIYFWAKGEERVIFNHPQVNFFTPICYEDIFPGEIASFVRDGGDVIMNLSNDYWSLSPVEGVQHAAAAMFRAVENARPLLRTTTSGLTCHVDPNGRVIKTLPPFEEGYYVTDVPLPQKGFTFYTLTGDWFPWFCMAGLIMLFIYGFFERKTQLRFRNIPQNGL
ncbi:MAG: apolipoprotein N-acyltransferase [Spirochaetales bacterium]|nr:apolipoprotein N-acyltransferase [Spirochaetales bacterium]